MSEPQFTKGPWRIHVEQEYSIGRIKSVYICGEGDWPGSQLARVNVTDELDGQRANASLIAAAPELFEVCAALEKHLAAGCEPASVGFAIRERMRTALAKASS